MANATAVFSPGQRFVDDQGVPYSLCTVNVFAAGTTTGKVVYADAELTTPLGSVVYTDSAGYPVTASGSTTKTLVYTDTDSYKIRITDASSVVICEHDNVKGAVVASSTAGGSFLTQDAADVRYVRNPNALAAVTTLTTGDKLPAYIAAAAGNRQIDWADLTADLLSEWRAAGNVFSAGARVAFQQTTPPTGWTKETNATFNDAALRFTTGTASTGGTKTFSTAFTSRTPTGTMGGYTLAVGDLPNHSFTIVRRNYLGSYNGNITNISTLDGTATFTSSDTVSSSSVGSGNSHTHSFTGDAIDFAVKFADCSIGQKS